MPTGLRLTCRGGEELNRKKLHDPPAPRFASGRPSGPVHRMIHLQPQKLGTTLNVPNDDYETP
jgi:hypothetical protein